jgi:hypothetical protein
MKNDKSQMKLFHEPLLAGVSAIPGLDRKSAKFLNR